MTGTPLARAIALALLGFGAYSGALWDPALNTWVRIALWASAIACVSQVAFGWEHQIDGDDRALRVRLWVLGTSFPLSSFSAGPTDTVVLRTRTFKSKWGIGVTHLISFRHNGWIADDFLEYSEPSAESDAVADMAAALLKVPIDAAWLRKMEK